MEDVDPRDGHPANCMDRDRRGGDISGGPLHFGTRGIAPLFAPMQVDPFQVDSAAYNYMQFLPFGGLTSLGHLSMVSRSFVNRWEVRFKKQPAAEWFCLPDSVMEAHVTLTHRVQVRTLVGQPLENIMR